MKKAQLLNRPVSVSELTFQDLYDEISQDWQSKAQKLQARRWRHLRRELRGSGH